MITIDSVIFDHKRGQVLLPESDAVPFRSNSITGVGIQVTQARSPGFTLTLTRFIDPDDYATERATLRAKIGTAVPIVERINGTAVNYSGIGGYNFVVTQAREVAANVVPGWHGYRWGVGAVTLEPAMRLVVQMTMYAVAL